MEISHVRKLFNGVKLDNLLSINILGGNISLYKSIDDLFEIIDLYREKTYAYYNWLNFSSISHEIKCFFENRIRVIVDMEFSDQIDLDKLVAKCNDYEIHFIVRSDYQVEKVVQHSVMEGKLWFSYPDVMGITWWNVVDGGAAKGEPSFSGIFRKDMTLKPVYNVLDSLINHEWKTKLQIEPDKDGNIKFRGFKGKYKITWKDRQN